jgi:hypothetical protein
LDWHWFIFTEAEMSLYLYILRINLNDVAGHGVTHGWRWRGDVTWET